MMSTRFFFKLLIFSVLWASLTAAGAPLTSVAVASSLQASVEMRAIVHFFRGANFQRDKELNEAIDQYKQALKLDDQFAEAYNNLGTVYFEKGDYGKATEFYEKALDLHEDFAAAHSNMGTVYARQAHRMNVTQFYRRAIVHLQKAIELDPNLPEAYNTLGIVYHRRGEYHRSSEFFMTAKHVRPSYVDAYNNL
ncbi:MAG: tetratricopeptide repeat protein [Acidobacteria bacterium]|nr:tetratricopeptide repeat protein [Acidobacteriota bacterium]